MYKYRRVIVSVIAIVLALLMVGGLLISAFAESSTSIQQKIDGLKDQESAIAALTDATAETIAIPAGLYYRITPAAELGTWGTAATGLSSGSVDAPAISNSAEQKGFYKVELSATPFK